jgi:hypothetical protein
MGLTFFKAGVEKGNRRLRHGAEGEAGRIVIAVMDGGQSAIRGEMDWILDTVVD